MKPILSVLTCAAVLALAGPALAGKSTPQEIEATKQLNLEQAQQAKNTTQQIAAANPNAPSQNANTPSQAAPAASPTTPVETAPVNEQAQTPAPADNAAASPQAQ